MLVKNPQYPTPAAMCIPKVFSFVLICMMLSGGATAATPDSVVIDVQEGRVALSWGGAARLVGGVPHFEGADVSLRSKGGLTALLFAVRDGRIDAVRALVDGHANVNDAAPDGTSALHRS